MHYRPIHCKRGFRFKFSSSSGINKRNESLSSCLTYLHYVGEDYIFYHGQLCTSLDLLKIFSRLNSFMNCRTSSHLGAIYRHFRLCRLARAPLSPPQPGHAARSAEGPEPPSALWGARAWVEPSSPLPPRPALPISQIWKMLGSSC